MLKYKHDGVEVPPHAKYLHGTERKQHCAGSIQNKLNVIFFTHEMKIDVYSAIFDREYIGRRKRYPGVVAHLDHVAVQLQCA